MEQGAPPDRRRDPYFADLLAGSFRRLVGRPLVEPGDEPLTARLYHAAFCLLAHDGAADPCFIYANAAAQRRFGYTWTEFLTLPSRLSAEVEARGERQRALDAVAKNGFVEDYTGVRVTKTGQRFVIDKAVVWTLVDIDGRSHGQAAMFDRPA